MNFKSIGIISLHKSLATHKTKRYRNRPLEMIREIIVHHSATTSASVYDISKFHVSNKDWPAIAYHFVIGTRGEIFYTNTIDTVSYHCKGNNYRSVGICLLGNYTSCLPSDVQLDSLSRLINSLCLDLSISAVLPHNYYRNTICPGSNLSDYILSNF